MLEQEHAEVPAGPVERRRRDERTRPARRRKAKQEPKSDALEIGRALDLLDRLVATEGIEVSKDFDEDASARRLVPVLDDVERLLEVLLEDPQIEEVFASGDDVESLLRRTERP